MATATPAGPPQPRRQVPMMIAIAAFFIGLVIGYGLNEWKHSKDQRTLSISVPAEIQK
jgi:hypothetical protein